MKSNFRIVEKEDLGWIKDLSIAVGICLLFIFL